MSMINMDAIIVRPAVQADLPSLHAFGTALALETEGRLLQKDTLYNGILTMLASPQHGHFIVAEITREKQRRVIAQLMITYEWSDWRNAVFWWVQSVYVDPIWRRQGVYRAMHEYLIAQTKAHPHICGIRLYVEQHNRIAQTVYQRLGLSPSGYMVYEKDFRA
jgi:GNAT superfamily N-acetyltransferase